MSSATISPCGKYRYALWRYIEENAGVGSRGCLFIMLNPSTADASLDDPTIRRCIGFARREGCARLTVVNLFALRATDPDTLLISDDPTGPENLATVSREIRYHQTAGLIIAAWGAHKAVGYCDPKILESIYLSGAQCLGRTRAGRPKHPLYLQSNQPLEHWP